MNDTVRVVKEYKLQDIWDALVCSDFASINYWIVHIDTKEKDYDTPIDLTIEHLDKDDESKTTVTVVTPKMVKKAFIKAVENKEKHCWEYPIEDLEDQDS